MNIEQLEKIAQEICLQQGSHAPQLFIEGSENNVTAVVPDLPGDFDDRRKGFFVIGAKLALEAKIGSLKSVTFISEAWMSAVKKDQVMKVRPSEDPKRIECLIVSNLDVENNNKSYMSAFKMIRDKSNKLIKLERQLQDKDKKGAEVESPLLEALVLGFFMAKSKMAKENSMDKYNVGERRVVMN